MLADGVENSISAVAPQTNGADPDDLEEGELQDENCQDGLQVETKIEDLAGVSQMF